MGSKERLNESTFDSLAAMMAGYAEEAVQEAWRNHRRRLDLTDSSVEELEQILDGQSAEDLDFQSRLWGSYFGEVIRRRFGGEWEMSGHPGGGASVVPTLMVRGAKLYPLMKVYRRLTLGKAEDLRPFYALVSSRLGNPTPQ